MKSRTTYIFLALVFATGAVHAQPSGWQPAGEMPWRVAGGEAVVHDSLILFAGGFSDSLFAPVNWIQTFHPTSRVWHRAGTMVRPRRDFVAGTLGDSLLSCGGGPPGDSTMEAYPLWLPPLSSIYAASRKFSRLSPAGLVHDGNFYIIGGEQFGPPGTPRPYIIEFDLSTRTVTYQLDTVFQHGSMGVGQMVAVIDSTIYIFGGLFNTPSRMIHSFNVHTHAFTRLPVQLLQPRAYGRAVRLGATNRIMILGGRNEMSSALNSTEVFEVLPAPGSYAVSPGPPMMFARTKLMAAVFDGYVYAFGGFDQFQNVVRVVERYRLVTGVEEPVEIPSSPIRLMQNYPNPFNPLTSIEFRLSEPGVVSLRVFDLLGRETVVLVNGELRPGTHRVAWDATGLPAGLYLCRLQSGEMSETMKMLLLR